MEERNMTNYYPEKPDLSYKKTVVEMSAVIAYLQGKILVPKEIKRSAYIMFRNESGNGTKGINNNYAGIQADSGRWSEIYDSHIVGVVAKAENGTGKTRLFCAFDNFTISLDFLLERVEARGLYVGGHTHKITNVDISNPTELAIAYKREWVIGLNRYNPSEDEINSFLSMYRQAVKLFV